jgi:hypothetical protein
LRYIASISRLYTNVHVHVQQVYCTYERSTNQKLPRGNFPASFPVNSTANFPENSNFRPILRPIPRPFQGKYSGKFNFPPNFSATFKAGMFFADLNIDNNNNNSKPFPANPDPELGSVNVAPDLLMSPRYALRGVPSGPRAHPFQLGAKPLSVNGPKTASVVTGPGFGPHHKSPRVQLPAAPKFTPRFRT